jgi:hypothetical protein
MLQNNFLNDSFIVLKVGNSVGINDNNNSADDFSPEQNYPNLFNPMTVISYSTSEKGYVNL